MHTVITTLDSSHTPWLDPLKHPLSTSPANIPFERVSPGLPMSEAMQSPECTHKYLKPCDKTRKVSSYLTASPSVCSATGNSPYGTAVTPGDWLISVPPNPRGQFISALCTDQDLSLIHIRRCRRLNRCRSRWSPYH